MGWDWVSPGRGRYRAPYGANDLCFGMLDDLLANNPFGPTMIQ